MSGASFEQQPTSERSKIRDEAQEWFARAQIAPLDGDSLVQLEAWLGRSASHRAAYWRLEGAWEEAGRLTALRPATRVAQSALRHGPGLSSKLVAAVAVLAVVAVAVLQFRSTSPGPKEYATDVGGRKILTLADGSQIELNTDTSIRVAIASGSRTVWLDRGEAYFQVVHDAAHPFSVIAGNRRVVDLGTKFTARQDAGKLEVSLFEGRARLEIAGGATSRSAELKPGDVAVASATAISVVRKAPTAMDSELGWRRGVLVFKGTALADAAAEMNRYNTGKIVVSDPTIARQTIDGTFPIHAVRQFSEMAQAVFGLRVEKHGTETIITR